jgi:hypothetical protein
VISRISTRQVIENNPSFREKVALCGKFFCDLNYTKKAKVPPHLLTKQLYCSTLKKKHFASTQGIYLPQYAVYADTELDAVFFFFYKNAKLRILYLF